MGYTFEYQRENGDVIKLDNIHNIRGSIYPMGGTDEVQLDVTYNYSKILSPLAREKFGVDSWVDLLRDKHSRDAVKSLRVLSSMLSGEPDDDYWAVTEGNAKAAIDNLVYLCELSLNYDGMWNVY